MAPTSVRLLISSGLKHSKVRSVSISANFETFSPTKTLEEATASSNWECLPARRYSEDGDDVGLPSILPTNECQNFRSHESPAANDADLAVGVGRHGMEGAGLHFLRCISGVECSRLRQHLFAHPLGVRDRAEAIPEHGPGRVWRAERALSLGEIPVLKSEALGFRTGDEGYQGLIGLVTRERQHSLGCCLMMRFHRRFPRPELCDTLCTANLSKYETPSWFLVQTVSGFKLILLHLCLLGDNSTCPVLLGH